MDPREFDHTDSFNQRSVADPQPEYRISITLAVHDVAHLWSAAAAKAMTAPGTRIEDVLDTIGPREAPSVRDCIAMLAAPGALPGCRMDDFWIDGLPGLPSRAELVRIAATDGWANCLPQPLAR